MHVEHSKYTKDIFYEGDPDAMGEALQEDALRESKKSGFKRVDLYVPDDCDRPDYWSALRSLVKELNSQK